MPKFHSTHDILDFAIAKERQAHDFYMKLAALARKPEVRRALRELATDELQHRIRLEAIKAGEAAFVDEEVGHLDIAETVAEVKPGPDMTYADLLVIAMKKEKAAFRLYTNLASIAKTKQQRETLQRLAQEEAQHKLRLEIEYDWETF
jgi:rubrerythrin